MAVLDCGHESTCWCSCCHLCEDVTDDQGDAAEEEDDE